MKGCKWGAYPRAWLHKHAFQHVTMGMGAGSRDHVLMTHSGCASLCQVSFVEHQQATLCLQDFLKLNITC